MKQNHAITLISLVITVIILLILAGVTLNIIIGDNGLLNKSEQSVSEHEKQEATEKMTLKVTNLQMKNYTEKQKLPTLQELADGLCEDDEMEYVVLDSKAVGSLNKIEVGERTSIFTKIKQYPYEFEINDKLQLASIDGVKVSYTNETEKMKELEDKISNLEMDIAQLQNGFNNKCKLIERPLKISTISAENGKWVNMEQVVISDQGSGKAIVTYSICTDNNVVSNLEIEIFKDGRAIATDSDRSNGRSYARCSASAIVEYGEGTVFDFKTFVDTTTTTINPSYTYSILLIPD